MKKRSDFVTNSSSTAYIISYPDQLTPRLRRAIIQTVMSMFGEPVTNNGYASPYDNEVAEREDKMLDQHDPAVQEALDKKYEVRLRTTDPKIDTYDEDRFLYRLFKAMEQADPEHFDVVIGME